MTRKLEWVCLTRIVLLALLVSLIVWPPISSLVLATAGDLDLAFANGGKATAHLGFQDEANAIALQKDGKIIVAGASSYRGTHPEFVIFRFNPDGSPDHAFGTMGFTSTSFEDKSWAKAVAVQHDGKIIAGGQAFNNFALVRYNVDGSLDTTFEFDGKVTTEFPGQGEVRAILVQPDGKIVAVGYANGDFALARYNSDGTLDASFGSGGRVLTDFSSLNDTAQAAVLLPNGRIVAAGFYMNNGTTFEFAVAKYRPNGNLDSSFGSGGKVTTAIAGTLDAATTVAAQADGKIVVGGRAFKRISNDDDFAVVRYNTDGSLDTSFGLGGKVTTDFSGALSSDAVNSVAVQPDGKILAAGFAGVAATNGDFAFARYTATGSLDDSFGVGGKMTTDFSASSDAISGIVIQPDGRIVATGNSTTPDRGLDFAVARYESGIPIPKITGASVTGKKLFITGENFDQGAVILINDERQKSANDATSPTTKLIGKKSGKKVRMGDRLRVQNADGTISPEFVFTGS